LVLGLFEFLRYVTLFGEKTFMPTYVINTPEGNKQRAFYDFTPILEDKLFQGACPPSGDVLSQVFGFDVVALCALELQDIPFENIQVIRCPLLDEENFLSPDTMRLVENTSKELSGFLKEGKRVLVTCHMGLNRSGLVLARTLMRFGGMSGSAAITEIQRKRSGALFNESFKRYILSKDSKSGVSY
jgi:Dual specificity phosphatase, catalytic domain